MNKRRFQIGATLILSTLCLSLTAACVNKKKVVIKLVPPSSTSLETTETVPKTTPMTTPATTPAVTTEPRTTLRQYDFSKEFDVGDLSGKQQGTPPVYSFTENPPELLPLQNQLNQFIQEKGLAGKRFSIIVDDLLAQKRVVIKPDDRYSAASVIKVAMAMVCDQLTEEGIFPVDMQILYVMDEKFTSDGADESKIGKPVSLQSMLDQALLHSNNAATSAVFSYFERHKCQIHFFMDGRCGTQYAKDVTLSAREGIGLIEQLYFNQQVYPGYQTILNTMTQNSWKQYLTGGIPIPVSSKYGQVGANNHEIGLIWAERPFAYAVFSEGVDGYSIFPELGTLIYQYAAGATGSSVDEEIIPIQGGETPGASTPTNPSALPGNP